MSKKYIIQVAVVLLLMTAFISQAQTFTGSGGPIPDDGTHAYFDLTVDGVVPATIGYGFGLETVCINLTHTWDADLNISLIAPDGKEFDLTSGNGGDGDGYVNTCFNYSASTAIYLAGAPFTGTYKPEGFMSIVNNGQNPNGVWRLHILDTWAWADAGTLFDWSVTFGTNPAVPFNFSGAHLPLVVINTSGTIIPDEPKVSAMMKIISNGNGQLNHPDDPPNGYDGKIGIEVRGASSASYPKKPYSFETREFDGSNNDVSLLGLPADNDWVLYASYSDKSLLRNYYSFKLFREMGHWAPRWEFCELMIDGEYQGIYLLGEKIKKSVDRVNIQSMTPEDTSGVYITGGYMYKLDWEDAGDVGFYSDFQAVNNANPLKYLMAYPKPQQVAPQQLQYLKAFVDSFEYATLLPSWTDTITGYRKYIDQQSFIDYIILNEFTKNLDAYRLSTFFHKDRLGKIHAGPPWDYDLAWGNGDFMEAYLPSGWNYQVQMTYSNQCPFWWQRFFKDSTFMDQLRCRWEELRQTILEPEYVKSQIDSLAGYLQAATNVNFTKWNILGQYVWPNPAPIPTTYAGEIDKLKDWVDLRITWLDNHWTGTCTSPNAITEITGDDASMLIYPNPSHGELTVALSGTGKYGLLSVFDFTGRLVYQDQYQDMALTFHPDVKPGMYYLRFEGNHETLIRRFTIN